MAPEIVRKLVGGKWRTVEENPSGNGGSQAVLSVTKSISSAEILALADTPIAVLAGVSGKAIMAVLASITYLAGETPYTDNGGVLSLDVGGAVFWTQAASQMTFTTPYSSFASNTAAAFDGIGLQLGLIGGAVNPTDGDGTLVVCVAYVLVPTA